MPDTETIFARLQAEGLQLTEPRRVVIAAIAERTVPFTSAELQEAIEAEAPAIGRATVFRTLDLLCRLGISCRGSTKMPRAAAAMPIWPASPNTITISSARAADAWWTFAKTARWRPWCAR